MHFHGSPQLQDSNSEVFVTFHFGGQLQEILGQHLALDFGCVTPDCSAVRSDAYTYHLKPDSKNIILVVKNVEDYRILLFEIVNIKINLLNLSRYSNTEGCRIFA